MEEKKSFKLFREKSLEAVESPEALNDYLRVTSPGVWLVLGAVIALLIGCVLWSIFGRINTSVSVAVTASGGKSVCLMPYSALQEVLSEARTVSVDGREYPLKVGADVETLIVSEETSPYVRVAGGLGIGDVAVQIPVEGELDDGVYQGSVQTESLRPISLLLQ